MNHTEVQRDDAHPGGWPRPPGRPVFKCLDCRKSLFVRDVMRSGSKAPKSDGEGSDGE